MTKMKDWIKTAMRGLNPDHTEVPDLNLAAVETNPVHTKERERSHFPTVHRAVRCERRSSTRDRSRRS